MFHSFGAQTENERTIAIAGLSSGSIEVPLIGSFSMISSAYKVFSSKSYTAISDLFQLTLSDQSFKLTKQDRKVVWVVFQVQVQVQVYKELKALLVVSYSYSRRAVVLIHLRGQFC